jgi:hypothetical protein
MGHGRQCNDGPYRDPQSSQDILEGRNQVIQEAKLDPNNCRTQTGTGSHRLRKTLVSNEEEASLPLLPPLQNPMFVVANETAHACWVKTKLNVTFFSIQVSFSHTGTGIQIPKRANTVNGGAGPAIKAWDLKFFLQRVF